MIKKTINLENKPELARVIEFLQRDSFHGFTEDDLFIMQFVKNGWGQDIAALSNMAETLMNASKAELFSQSYINELLESVVRKALHEKVSPYKRNPESVKGFGRYGYYLEHLNIILGCYQCVVDDKYLELNRRITSHLLQVSLKEENLHAPLLPNVCMRWSADQAGIIYSIWLFDQNNTTSLSHEICNKWLNYMYINMQDIESGLFRTEVMGVKRYSKQPRGCALAYLIYYMSHFAPHAALDQWNLFKNHMLIERFGVHGFREYLPTFEGHWTPDSGPIVEGIGAGASGLALKTASSMSDTEVYNDLSGSISAVMKLMRGCMHLPLLRRFAMVGTDLLAASIKSCADTRIMFQKHDDSVIGSEAILSNGGRRNK